MSASSCISMFVPSGRVAGLREGVSVTELVARRLACVTRWLGRRVGQLGRHKPNVVNELRWHDS